MTRRFTGRHMMVLMIAFFGLILGVNITMARLASATFGGVVVDNSYVASQQFNGWLASARAQARLGWQAVAHVDADGRLVIDAHDAAGRPIDGRVTVVARHPLGRMPDQRLELQTVSGGGYRSARALPAGRWLLLIDLHSQGRDARFEQEVRA